MLRGRWREAFVIVTEKPPRSSGNTQRPPGPRVHNTLILPAPWFFAVPVWLASQVGLDFRLKYCKAKHGIYVNSITRDRSAIVVHVVHQPPAQSKELFTAVCIAADFVHAAT